MLDPGMGSHSKKHRHSALRDLFRKSFYLQAATLRFCKLATATSQVATHSRGHPHILAMRQVGGNLGAGWAPFPRLPPQGACWRWRVALTNGIKHLAWALATC